MQKVLISAFIIASLSGSGFAQATYRYTGNPFTFFSCGPNADDTATMDCSTPAPTNIHTSYTATDHVTATLTLDAPHSAGIQLDSGRRGTHGVDPARFGARTLFLCVNRCERANQPMEIGDKHRWRPERRDRYL
jgi:hypothetical protein